MYMYSFKFQWIPTDFKLLNENGTHGWQPYDNTYMQLNMIKLASRSTCIQKYAYQFYYTISFINIKSKM